MTENARETENEETLGVEKNLQAEGEAERINIVRAPGAERERVEREGDDKEVREREGEESGVPYLGRESCVIG